MILLMPYGRSCLEFDLPEDRIISILGSEETEPASDETENVRKSLLSPIGSESLSDAVSKSRSVCVTVSDYTRATPNWVLIPPILEQVQRGGKSLEELRLLVANGLHEPAPENELEELLGKSVMQQFEVVNHYAEDRSQLEYVGRTSFGTEVLVNKLVVASDLVILTGLIEPHFFAGYSGGRKSILPGVTGRDSIYQNHSYSMIGHPMSCYGVLDGNPIHEDMIEAAEMTIKGRSFLVNVVIDKRGEVVKAFSGDIFDAHKAGVEFLDRIVKAKAPESADVVITSNGGYPLDRDLYQAVKGMATGRLVVKEGGVIVVLSECLDGIGRGHESFYRLMAEEKGPEEVLDTIRREEPIKDQWEAQILAQTLLKAHVILVSRNIKHSLVEEMHLIPASDPEEALETAEKLAGKEARIIAVPEGPCVIPAVTKREG